MPQAPIIIPIETQLQEIAARERCLRREEGDGDGARGGVEDNGGGGRGLGRVGGGHVDGGLSGGRNVGERAAAQGSAHQWVARRLRGWI